MFEDHSCHLKILQLHWLFPLILRILHHSVRWAVASLMQINVPFPFRLSNYRDEFHLPFVSIPITFNDFQRPRATTISKQLAERKY